MTRTEIGAVGTPPTPGHFTNAVRLDGLVFLSGAGPVDELSQLVGAGDIERQAQQTLENLSLVLRASGSDFSRVLKINIYLLSIADLPKITAVRKQYFGDTRPASTAVGVSELAIPGMLIEIDLIASCGDSA